MRSVLYLVTALIVMGLAFWAYRENYRTQAQIDRMQAVQNEMAGLRENLGVLRAEWAYLNRPDRLRGLVDLNFDRLRLVPVGPAQFGAPRNVDYPAPDAPATAEPGALDGAAQPRARNPGGPPPKPRAPTLAQSGTSGAALSADPVPPPEE